MSLLRKNFIVIFGVGFSNVLAFVFHFAAGRLLGPEQYGEFGVLMALIIMLSLPKGALNVTVNKFISSFNQTNPVLIQFFKRKVQKEVLVGFIVLFGLTVTFRHSITNYLKIDDSSQIYTVCMASLLAILMMVNRGVTQGTQRYFSLSWNSILESTVRLLMLFIFFYLGFKSAGAILAFTVAYFISFLALEWDQSNHLYKGSKGSFRRSTFYGFLAMVLITQLIIQGVINLPTIYVKHYYSSEFTGFWNAGLTIARTILFVSGSISLVLFTETANSNDERKRRKWLLISTALVMVISSFMAIIFYYFSGYIIEMLYGREFSRGADILKWMGVAMIFLSLIDLWANFFLARYNTRPL